MSVYRINGKVVTEKEWRKHRGVGFDFDGSGPLTFNTYRDHDPLVSEGAGVMKSQVPEMRREIRKRNIQGVKVRDNGQLEITSRQGRRELLRMRGLADADGGYSD